ncbi:larval cuticle protein LCP-17-like [Aphomia sociella]
MVALVHLPQESGEAPARRFVVVPYSCEVISYLTNVKNLVLLVDSTLSWTTQIAQLFAVCLAVVVISIDAQLVRNLLGNINKVAARILKYDNNNDGSGNYNFNYEQSDGTKHEQIGILRNADGLNPFVVAKGIYEWISPENRKYRVNYEADENGYRSEIEEGPGVPPNVAATLLGG